MNSIHFFILYPALQKQILTRVHAVLNKLQDAKQQIEDCGFFLNKDGLDVLEHIQELADTIESKTDLIKSVCAAPPVLEQIEGFPAGELEDLVDYAEQWATVFQEQAKEAQSQTNPEDDR